MEGFAVMELARFLLFFQYFCEGFSAAIATNKRGRNSDIEVLPSGSNTKQHRQLSSTLSGWYCHKQKWSHCNKQSLNPRPPRAQNAALAWNEENPEDTIDMDMMVPLPATGANKQAGF